MLIPFNVLVELPQIDDLDATPAYLRAFILAMGDNLIADGTPDQPQSPQMAVDRLLSRRRFTATDLPATFRVEEMGNCREALYIFASHWKPVLALLGKTDPALRQRLLGASVEGLLRDFKAIKCQWSRKAHLALSPDIIDIMNRFDRYLAVVAATPSASVGMALDLLAKVVGELDQLQCERLIEVGSAVLVRQEKSFSKRSCCLPGLQTAIPYCFRQYSSRCHRLSMIFPFSCAPSQSTTSWPAETPAESPPAPNPLFIQLPGRQPPPLGWVCCRRPQPACQKKRCKRLHQWMVPAGKS
ncbi:hypothetical protein ACFSSC_07200 [Corynebacterium mendelii]|uniref:Uncharacterized protein n=1 Tax=Corynebacterium mendelii TaxID=2765362 RepID=A0A939IUF7_9CORY|nr:hypothetical protein [Corynebacterium mendelii]MBN9644884.1 hypothetical protein [Corynebacterium mendelii]